MNRHTAKLLEGKTPNENDARDQGKQLQLCHVDSLKDVLRGTVTLAN